MPSNNTQLPNTLLLFLLLNTLLSLLSLPLTFIVLFTALALTAYYRLQQSPLTENKIAQNKLSENKLAHSKFTNSITKIIAYLLVLVSLILIWQQLEFPSLIAIAAVLTSLSWAKICELKSNRDKKFIWFLSSSLLALQLIILINYQMLIAFIGIPLLFFSASELANKKTKLNKQPKANTQGLNTSNKLLLVRLSALLATSLPFALILFVTLPRINLPMQELGLAMGLPITVEVDKNLAAKGLGQELGFDDIGEQGQSDSRVLLASLPSDFIQNSEQPLYWKGPVYWRYTVTTQGNTSTEKWQLRHGFTNRSQRQYNGFGSNDALANMTSQRDNTIEYSVILMAHGEYWLYALDLPQTLTGESYLSQDYQLLSIRKVDSMWRYKITSSLNYQISEKEPQSQLTLGLQYPENNPQIKALGEQWQQQFAQQTNPTQSIVEQAKQFFTQGKYLYANTGEKYQGQHQLDQFLFNKKVGYSQHYASALTLLLRAAGVPARLVAGYRGADKVGLTNMYTVNEHHAHAWVEAYITNNQGQSYWQRIDPALWLVDLFSANTNKESAPNKQEQLEKQQSPQIKKNSPADATKTSNKPTTQSTSSHWLDSLNQWTLKFDANKQNQLANKLGIKTLLWWHLLLIALGLLFTLLVLYYLVIRFINRGKKVAEHICIYQQVCKKLAKKGLPKLSHEGAQTYLTRCAASSYCASNQQNHYITTQNITAQKSEQIINFKNTYLLLAYSKLNNTEQQQTLAQLKILASNL